MSFAERAQSRPRTIACPVGDVILDLDESEAAFLRAMLADPARPHTGEKSIQEAIEEETGTLVSDRTIRVHRGRKCRCSDELR